MSQTMKAIEISEPGGPEVLKACERPRPTPGPGQVLIRVAAAGVNRPDVFQRMGAYPPPPGASDLPGLEVAGTIVDGDCGDSGFAVGDRVCALVHGGGYAEYCLADNGVCLPIPDGLDEIQAAVLPETCFTVWSNVFDRAALAPGESLLVQGGSSGIGVTAIQIASALGHPVFATAGSAEKCQACESLGATAINYREQDFVAVVRELTGDRGVDVILDMVAGDYVPREIDCLAEDGRIVIIALLGGARLPLGRRSAEADERRAAVARHCRRRGRARAHHLQQCFETASLIGGAAAVLGGSQPCQQPAACSRRAAVLA